MNARINPANHAPLFEQADTCSAVCLLFLETSGKYFDLHMDSLKQNLESCRQEFERLPGEPSAREVLERFSALWMNAMTQSHVALREAYRLAATSQSDLQTLMAQGHEQWRATTVQVTEHHVRLLRLMLGQPLAA